MPLSALCTTLLALIWTQTVHSRLEDHQQPARIRITQTEGTFSSFDLPNAERNAVWKLVKDPYSSKIYAGASHGLYEFNPGEKPRGVTQGCVHSISVLTEGKNGYPLFVCEKEVKKCCKVDSGYNPVDCFEMQGNAGDVNEAALFIGDTLYFTISGQSNAAATLGLYRQKASNEYTWPQTRDIAQRYIKLIADEGSAAKDGKLYSFYIEKNLKEDPETPLWIPRVSQYCMSDTGGSKQQLQYRWTSMLTARLFCGDKKGRVTFTELLDVAVLEEENWNNTAIYALFKNHYCGLVAVKTTSQNAGMCVTDKSAGFLKFMEKRPEMAEWIEPERGPLLISQSQYSHLQVDRVTGGKDVLHIVLLLTLDKSAGFLKFMEKRPEMAEWIEPERGPLLISQSQYSHLQVDRVTGGKDVLHIVLLLTLDKSAGFLKFMEKRPEMAEWIEPERGPLLISQSQYSHLQVDRVTGGKDVLHIVLLLTLDKSAGFLKFMEKRPEMAEWIEPERGPLLISQSQYSHLQVDRVTGGKDVLHIVLLLTLDKSAGFLKFMEKRPEMAEWIEPERGPLLISQSQYSHLQVDRVTGGKDVLHIVLLLTLGNGRILKVVERDDGPFIIAEYQPFKSDTRVLSTLLDRSTKKLYVSSSSELVQIDLQDCSIYGKQCESCVLARDPYCTWRGTECSPATEYSIQDVKNGDDAVCEADRPKAGGLGTSVMSESALIVPPNSKYYLKCPSPSQHASYTWVHNGKKKGCVFTERECLLLIDNMSEEDLGQYECIASESGQEWTVVSYHLGISASQPGVAPVTLACPLLLISLICFQSLS